MDYISKLMGFTKLFSTIVQSTIWNEDSDTCKVWITMLALANRNGVVMASVPGLAHSARVPLERCVDALAKFTNPDPWSRTKEFEGRRIEEVDGGWVILNYPKFREMRNEDERRIQTLEAVRRYRAKRVSHVSSKPDVSHGKPKQKQITDTEADKSKRDTFEQRWATYPRKRGKELARRSFSSQVTTPEELISFDSAVRNYREEIEILQIAEKFVMHGATFFNQKWKDYADGTWQRPDGGAAASRHHAEFDDYRD